MPSLDTNILLRFLLEDDLEQTETTFRFLDHATSVFVPLSVILETEWVLRSRYNYPKTEVMRAFRTLLGIPKFTVQNEEILEYALFTYRKHNIEFTDCIHYAAACTQDHLPLVTFDRKAARLDGVETL